jgi:hypothetical protein
MERGQYGNSGTGRNRPLAGTKQATNEKPRPRGSTDGVLNLEVSRHPEKLGRSRRVLTKVYQGNCG